MTMFLYKSLTKSLTEKKRFSVCRDLQPWQNWCCFLVYYQICHKKWSLFIVDHILKSSNAKKKTTVNYLKEFVEYCKHQRFSSKNHKIFFWRWGQIALRIISPLISQCFALILYLDLWFCSVEVKWKTLNNLSCFMGH